MIDFNITNEELNALKTYMNKDYEAINQMLVSDCETDIALLSSDVENKIVNISYLRENVIEYLKNIKLIYRLILKKYYSNNPNKNIVLYRGTNLAEIERLKNELYIDRMLLATKNRNVAENKYSSIWNRPTCLTIKLDSKVPFVILRDIFEDNTENVLISPFTKIKNITVGEEKKLKVNSKILKNYVIELEKQNLDELSADERNGLYNYILDNAYSIKRRIEECIELEKENTTNFENIRKLEQLLVKYESNDYEDNDEDSIIVDNDDVGRITKELDELKKKSNTLFEVRKQNINFVNIWKRNIAVYMIAECREIEKEFEDVKEEFDNKIDEEKKIEEIKENEPKDNIIEEENKSSQNLQNTIIFDNKKIEKEEKNSLIYEAELGAKENIESAKKLITDINSLISKQQNHAKIAGNIGTTYSALNNAFEMRKVAEKLLELLENVNLKIKVYSKEKQTKEIEEKIEKISKMNLEISTLFNYLNNPKIAAVNSKATRFDEMAIIEENELKRNIAEKIREIRGEAELKKLKDDLEIIEDKGTFARILGIFTGQNKLDEFMIEQIEIRQNAIRKTLSKKLSLAHNYSIHKLIAEIEMFVSENEDDELVEDDIIDLKAMEEELKRNYIILDSKVDSIIEEKEGKNLPLKDKKISKREMIEIETYRFLNKYGYDIDFNESEEPKYQDTVASEISRMIEYINSSEI